MTQLHVSYRYIYYLSHSPILRAIGIGEGMLWFTTDDMNRTNVEQILRVRRFDVIGSELPPFNLKFKR